MTVTTEAPAVAAPTRSVRGRLASIAVGLVAVFAVVLLGALVVVPAITGGQALTVLSGSMRPAIDPGDVVVIEPVAAQEIHVGDVITYERAQPHELVTHRVVEELPGQRFVTRGDANNVADSPAVTSRQIRGELSYRIPFVGLVRDHVFTPAGMWFGAALLLVLVAVWALRSAMRRSA